MDQGSQTRPGIPARQLRPTAHGLARVCGRKLRSCASFTAHGPPHNGPGVHKHGPGITGQGSRARGHGGQATGSGLGFREHGPRPTGLVCISYAIGRRPGNARAGPPGAARVCGDAIHRPRESNGARRKKTGLAGRFQGTAAQLRRRPFRIPRPRPQARPLVVPRRGISGRPRIQTRRIQCECYSSGRAHGPPALSRH